MSANWARGMETLVRLTRERDTFKAQRDRLLAELKAMTEHYVKLVVYDTGGYCDPSDEEEVIAARTAIAECERGDL